MRVTPIWKVDMIEWLREVNCHGVATQSATVKFGPWRVELAKFEPNESSPVWTGTGFIHNGPKIEGRHYLEDLSCVRATMCFSQKEEQLTEKLFKGLSTAVEWVILDLMDIKTALTQGEWVDTGLFHDYNFRCRFVGGGDWKAKVSAYSMPRILSEDLCWCGAYEIGFGEDPTNEGTPLRFYLKILPESYRDEESARDAALSEARRCLESAIAELLDLKWALRTT